MCRLRSYYSGFSVTHVQLWHTKMEMLSQFLTQILIHVAQPHVSEFEYETALIGILFALLQWLYVSSVRVLFAANHTEANIGYKAVKITTYVNARTTLEARKGKRKGFRCCFSLWCSDGLSSCCKLPVIGRLQKKRKIRKLNQRLLRRY
ncbi:putative inorganic diphosphatase [Medicago truncatula]|uniref:Putative inorganic diphosphatase n=1 Tax=Medicago truncatula TaxID=3880 RepID=A0A396JTI5_MEDTR|nr:putative inorganic diphosphatase [Medicago truncatula]